MIFNDFLEIILQPFLIHVPFAEERNLMRLPLYLEGEDVMIADEKRGVRKDVIVLIGECVPSSFYLW